MSLTPEQIADGWPGVTVISCDDGEQVRGPYDASLTVSKGRAVRLDHTIYMEHSDYAALKALTSPKENAVVEQADREATSQFLCACGMEGDDVPQDIRDGEKDDSNGVQAFARHRTQAVEAERARVVAWLRDDDDSAEAKYYAFALATMIERGDHLDGGMGEA